MNDKVERNLNDADGVEGRNLFRVIKETKKRRSRIILVMAIGGAWGERRH